MRRDAKVDRVQQPIVEALRAVGADVQSLANVGQGVPDILVHYQGTMYLMELKSPGGMLTAAQVKWHRGWRGTVHVVRSVDEALAAIGAVAYKV